MNIQLIKNKWIVLNHLFVKRCHIIHKKNSVYLYSFHISYFLFSPSLQFSYHISLAFCISAMRFYLELAEMNNQIIIPSEESIVQKFTQFNEEHRPFVRRGDICESIMAIKDFSVSLMSLGYNRETIAAIMSGMCENNTKLHYKYIHYTSFRSLAWSCLLQALSERKDFTSEQTIRELCILSWMGIKMLYS